MHLARVINPTDSVLYFFIPFSFYGFKRYCFGSALFGYKSLPLMYNMALPSPVCIYILVK